MTTPVWISVEGLNGVGKTFLTTRLANRLGPSCHRLSELTDHAADQFTGRVIGALTRPDQTYLRTGHPLTETFALLALKVHEYEHLIRSAGAASARPSDRVVVLEDRGVDTVAVYQAAILAAAGHGEASDLTARIHAAAALWRPPPRLTLLLVDDLDTCIRRFEQRTGQPVTGDDRHLLTQVAGLYADLAARHPDRIQVVDRAGRSAADTLAELRQHCEQAVTAATTEPDPGREDTRS